MRAKSYEAVGDVISAISDLRVILKSQTENQLRYLKLSELYYEIGETEEALKYAATLTTVLHYINNFSYDI